NPRDGQAALRMTPHFDSKAKADQPPRIVSFLPAATEITYALGAGDYLVGRSHECDYPPEVKDLPVVSRPALPIDELPQSEIDAAVSQRLASGQSLYLVDEQLLSDLRPDYVFTQDLCQVCAPSGNELTRALVEMSPRPTMLWLTPRTIDEIEENILSIGEATQKMERAQELVEDNRRRIARVEHAVRRAIPRRVVFLEWIDPFYCAGHWVPEMIAAAGGYDPIGQSAADSRRMTWDEIIAADPEVIIVAPCGYGLADAMKLATTLRNRSSATIYAVDANSYFARPGPRVAEGVELLAHIFHPQLFEWPHPHMPFARMDRSRGTSTLSPSHSETSTRA
ncbi:MAG TPA: cobalamin-binding protein, partial [Gemmatimonadaceae bacterium]|nr:cobalamin-binding protein [Gemmatimonadaceae bacterium]